MTIAVLCAAGAGSVGGGLTALRVSPESPSTQPVTRPIVGSATAQPPKPSAGSAVLQPHAPDPHAVLVVQMQAVLIRVAEWSRSHAGAPCPDAIVLGIAALDPWGHPIELTCTEQPGDQIMGAISAGPDGIPGNSDDVKSWNLGPGVTQLVQGPRWKSIPVATEATSSKRRRDASSTNDPILTIRRTTSARPPGIAPPDQAPSTAPARASPAVMAPSPATSKPSIAPLAPIDAGDDIPTRR